MKYDETLATENSLEDSPTEEALDESQISPSKVVQLILDNPSQCPLISYTEAVTLSEVVGALTLALETLKTINVDEKLKKKRFMAAYNDL